MSGLVSWADHAEDWRRWSACASAEDVFFPPDVNDRNGHETPKAKQARIRAARAICAACPVVDDCLESVMAYEERAPFRFGFWAGMTEEQRDEYAQTGRRPHAPLVFTFGKKAS